MKKIFILYIFCILISNINAQNTWSIGAVYQPKITNIHHTNSTSNDFHFNPKYGFETGLVFTKEISPKFELDTRLLFSKNKTKYEIDISNDEYIDPIFSQSGQMIYEVEYTYLKLPIAIDYYLYTGKIISAGIRGGISIDKFLKKENEIIVGESLDNENPKELNVSGLIGIPLKYKINEKVDFLIEAQFTRMIFDNYDIKDQTTKWYSFGINIGLII